MAASATTKLMNIIKSLDQLDDSGNNFDSWLFKLDNLLVSAGLKESLDIKITNEDDEEETVNALTSRQHWKKLPEYQTSPINPRFKSSKDQEKPSKRPSDCNSRNMRSLSTERQHISPTTST